jgi:hypothetical protein
MNSFLRRLELAEKKAKTMFEATQEDDVCAYLQLVLSEDIDTGQAEQRFEKVKNVLPIMH